MLQVIRFKSHSTKFGQRIRKPGSILVPFVSILTCSQKSGDFLCTSTEESPSYFSQKGGKNVYLSRKEVTQQTLGSTYRLDIPPK
jgi:hypothetical protein